MKNPKAVTFICVAIALSTSCNKTPTEAAKRYHLKGKVVAIDKQGKMANIDSEAIPGFMGKMTMPYTVKPESELDQLKAGDVITADVVVQDEKAWLENVAVTGQAGGSANK